MIDWLQIKTDYITEATSYRKLAQKYGVPYTNIGKKAKEEGWMALREQYHDKTLTKTLENSSDKSAKRTMRIHAAADKMVDKIEQMMDSPEQELTPRALLALSSVLKNLVDIQGIKSEMDQMEQMARIDHLRQRNDKDQNAAQTLEVVFAAGPEEWNE